MLQRLTISQIVLIKHEVIGFSSGLCVLTGETGAGKSIILDALGLCLGARANVRLLRHGAEQGVVCAEFSPPVSKSPLLNLLEEIGIESGEILVLRRVLYADGKTRAFINDVPVNIQTLAKVGAHLLEIHGQHDQRGLLEASLHRDYLDDYAKLARLREVVASKYSLWKASKQVLLQLEQEQERSLREESYLRFAVAELEKISPGEGEETALIARRTLLTQREKIISAVQSARATLNSMQWEAQLSKAVRGLAVGGEQPAFQAAAEAIERSMIELAEADGQLQMAEGAVLQAGDNLEKVDDRLHELRQAARKYRVTVDGLSEIFLQMKNSLALITNAEEQLKILEKAERENRQNFLLCAEDLRAKRKIAAEKITAELEKELVPLKMAQAKLRVEITELDPDQWCAEGIDHVQFLACTNPGQAFAPLQKIASGGELSRFMLAMKVVLHDAQAVPTLIFDEIDTGIGGAVADAVGQRLQHLSKSAQILVVTHQPQVAVRASHHLHVSKKLSAGEMITKIDVLSDASRVDEIARMLSGADITDAARAAALQLLQAA
jgi:DNA repair protein RecN (Recombination protein N)